MMLDVGDAAHQEMRFQLNLIIVLKVVEGEVVQHVDYVDTEAFVLQMQEQKSHQL